MVRNRINMHDIQDYPKMPLENNYGFSELLLRCRWLYFRIKNPGPLGIRLPSDILGTWVFEETRLYVTGNDCFTSITY